MTSREANVNWCPELGIVLPDSEVENGVSKVGGHLVCRRVMRVTDDGVLVCDYSPKLVTKMPFTREYKPKTNSGPKAV